LRKQVAEQNPAYKGQATSLASDVAGQNSRSNAAFLYQVFSPKSLSLKPKIK